MGQQLLEWLIEWLETFLIHLYNIQNHFALQMVETERGTLILHMGCQPPPKLPEDPLDAKNTQRSDAHPGRSRAYHRNGTPTDILRILGPKNDRFGNNQCNAQTTG